MHVDISDRVEAEAVRLENAELLQRVMQTVDEGILVTDDEGALVKWNPAAETILGLDFSKHREDWRQWLRPLPLEGDAENSLEEFPLALALNGKPIMASELRVADAEGLPLYVSVSARPPPRSRRQRLRGRSHVSGYHRAGRTGDRVTPHRGRGASNGRCRHHHRNPGKCGVRESGLRADVRL